MNRKYPHRARVACIAALVSVLAIAARPAASQVGYKADPQGKDELWDVTSKMEMPGMPFAMPAQTNRVCVAKGDETGTIPQREGCTISESKRAGNTVTYRMNCKGGNNDYTATGESTSAGSGYQGRMRMAGKMDGQQMDMAMTYSGARAGNCTLSRQR
jgi:hypothetical protein